jgi:orotidine-5'-phosphate decarboxylase
MTWAQKLDSVSAARDSLVCVGLDPDPRRMPVQDVAEFNRNIVDATSDLVCAYKPQLAFYEALGIDGLRALAATVEHIRKAAPDAVIVGDAKRGDIDSTAEAYARAMFDVWGFDVVTVHAYLGRESVEPFLTRPDRGVLVVCRTSNPGARELQDLRLARPGMAEPGRREDAAGETGAPRLFEHVARLAAQWDRGGNVGLVVGATYPEELAMLRSAHPRLPILIPGVGAQGGDVEKAARAGANRDGRGVMISASRSIIYASNDPTEYPGAARAAAEKLRDDIRAALRPVRG